MVAACRRASLIAKASAIRAEETNECELPPLEISRLESLMIQPVPACSVSLLQAPSVLHVVVTVWGGATGDAS